MWYHCNAPLSLLPIQLVEVRDDLCRLSTNLDALFRFAQSLESTTSFLLRQYYDAVEAMYHVGPYFGCGGAWSERDDTEQQPNYTVEQIEKEESVEEDQPFGHKGKGKRPECYVEEGALGRRKSSSSAEMDATGSSPAGSVTTPTKQSQSSSLKRTPAIRRKRSNYDHAARMKMREAYPAGWYETDGEPPTDAEKLQLRAKALKFLVSGPSTGVPPPQWAPPTDTPVTPMRRARKVAPTPDSSDSKLRRAGRKMRMVCRTPSSPETREILSPSQ